jgi:hypothetical protein
MTTARQRLSVLLLAGVVAIAGAGWFLWTKFSPSAMDAGNSIVVIKPYRLHGTWVFDDPAAGLRQEPFVSGVPEMIDVLVKDIPNAKDGFRLLFSANKFPGTQKTLTWQRGDSGGNYYRMDSPDMEGWICPALFKYYKSAPKQLFVKAEAIVD